MIANAQKKGAFTMKTNPLLELTELGQSIWIDYLDRGQIASGQLQRHIDEDGLRGVTTNPSIFEKAMTGGLYWPAIDDLARQGSSIADIYEGITTRDVQLAADLFRPSFDRLDGRDGYVSLEVSPHLAQDTNGTIAEARRLWAAVNRPNAMIKVPATKAGLPAIQRLVSEGINVNVTLLFGLGRYEEVAGAYLAGLESRALEGHPIRLASVASFFLSRIDVLVDARLDELERAGRIASALAARLRGQVAIASARMAYQTYKRIISGERYAALAKRAARPQRLLWASTSAKNPAYSDVKYVEALIGKATINTVPLETLDAYRDHGNPALRLEEHIHDAADTLADLRTTGIDLDAVTRGLEEDGVRKFKQSYDRMLHTIAERREAVLHDAGVVQQIP
jgi:transaldolase